MSAIAATPFYRDEAQGIPSSPPEDISLTDNKLGNLMQGIIEQKQEGIQRALKGRTNVLEGVLIAGDFFSTAYLGFQGALAISSSLARAPSLMLANLICGEIAGAINIGVSFLSLKEGLQAWFNGDKKLAIRLLIDFVDFFLIGVVMMVAALTLKGAIGAFFSANPWLLPVLFFIVSLPVIGEIGSRLKNICLGKDLGSEFIKTSIDSLIQGENPHNPFHLKALLKMNETEAFNELSKKFELLQADMGVTAALEVFKTLRLALLRENIEDQFLIAQKRIQEWNRAQLLRLAQQVLFTATFAVSMVGLNPKINQVALNATENFGMSLANLIPLYMDIYWPFKRNTPIVVPKIDCKKRENCLA